MRLILAGCAVAGLSAMSIGAMQPATTAAFAISPTLALPVSAQASVSLGDGKFRGDLADIVAGADPDELIPISIVLSKQPDKQQIGDAARIPDKAQRRAAVIDLLKQTAANTQAGILELLEDAQQRGDVGEHIRALWISNVIAAKMTAETAHQIAARGDVAYLNWDRPLGEELFPVQPEPFAGGATGDPLGGQIECGVQLMGAPDVWADFNITGRNVVVGIIDTGCCITHPDLRNQIWNNPGEIPGNNIDDDNNGFIDDINGWNHWQNNADISDGNGHGTHTTGTVAGDGTNGIATGMAPDAEMMILKFWNNFSGESVVWASHQYALDNGADVITASIGWPHSVNPDRVTWRNVTEASMAGGIVVVYAAGNEGGGNPPHNVRTPGDVPDMITAGATDCNDNIASFSSRGPVTWESIPPFNDWPFPPGKLKPTVSAPGVSTTSTSNNCSGYRDLSGTSMATPHIAGAIALILEANPNLDHWEVKQILKDTAIDLGPNGPDNDYGAGRVDAYAAVVAAKNAGPTPADLTGIRVVVGSPLGGGLNEVAASDDRYFVGRSGFGQSLVEAHLLQVRVDANTTEASPSQLDVTIESRIDEPSGRVSVVMRNLNTGRLDFVGGFSVGSSDSTNSILGIAAGDYVDGGGNIEMHAKYVVFVPFLAFSFDGSIDLIQIDVQ